MQQVLATIDGAADASGDQVTGQPSLKIKVDQNKIARYGIPARHVLDVVSAIGNRRAGEIYEGQRSYPLVMRLPDQQREDIDAIAKTLIPTDSGPVLPLEAVTNIELTAGPSTINREWGRRLIRVQCNVRGRDVASFVEDAQEKIMAQVNLPEGYVINWGGQFENLERSQRRFLIVVPLTLLMIFILLAFSLKNIKDVLIIYTGIPFAAIGGIFALWLQGIPFSVSAAIGFIALSGIAVLNGQVPIAAIQRMREEGMNVFEAGTASGSVAPGAGYSHNRCGWLYPYGDIHRSWCRAQRPLATVVVGGVITSTILTLFVLPVLYQVFSRDTLNS